MSTVAKIVATGYVKELTWDCAKLVFLPVDPANSTHEDTYRLDVWEYYAAKAEPTFDLVECVFDANNVPAELADAFDLNEDNVTTYQIAWRADRSTYEQYLPADNDDGDTLEIEIIEGEPIDTGEYD